MYEDLKNLIEEWLNDPTDHDISIWPEIKINLENQKIMLGEINE